MHQVWRILAIILLAAMVFGAAAYLDRNPLKTTSVTLQSSSEEITSTTKPTGNLPAEREETILTETTLPPQTEVQEERFLLTFVGDCTFGTNPSNTYAEYGFIKTVGEDYQYPFSNVIQWFEDDECTFLNLEGPLTDVGNPMQKKHAFRGPTAYVNIITENSVEAVSIANNHTMDYGQNGYASTVNTLENAGIPFVERDHSCIFTTKNGLTIGLYGAVYYLLDELEVTAGISELKEQGCDLVIFAPHWGVEGAYRPTEQQIQLAHAAIDAGADIVWGSHPHVLQPIESYKGGMIYYSMGNFSFGGNGYPRDYDTALLQQEIILSADGIMTLGELTIVPCNVSSATDRNNFQPTPYESGTDAYERVLKKLDGSWTGPNLSIQ